VRKLIKIFAVWLIAVAIPVQGFASVAMMNCEQSPNHHSKYVAAATGHNHDQHSEHDMFNEHSHKAADVSNHTSQNADQIKHSCAHCAKCTSCCSGFAFQTTSSSLFQQLSAGEARFSYNTFLFAGFIASGLERPPQTYPYLSCFV
jgi:hypothetical protein